MVGGSLKKPIQTSVYDWELEAVEEFNDAIGCTVSESLSDFAQP